jgi:hypothetical protein
LSLRECAGILPHQGQELGSQLTRSGAAFIHLALAASHSRQAANGFLELGSLFRAAESLCTSTRCTPKPGKLESTQEPADPNPGRRVS